MGRPSRRASFLASWAAAADSTSANSTKPKLNDVSVLNAEFGLEDIPSGTTILSNHDVASSNLAELGEFLSEHVLVDVPRQVADKQVLALVAILKTVDIVLLDLLDGRSNFLVRLALLGGCSFDGAFGIVGVGIGVVRVRL